ncbi:tetratricopeptide repeat protein 19, mitochondrial-like [Chrysoperla carnea]|uniref:tetratricopeptide repeat protein 19, mitochondrial-like n=1 Tax=Chrysoperla carnea TaxID=189513 RepID=UPI001D064151|nr:tetratricopeptide repeat protein 19, mitochondrial-like [Chrysoperla carnea]
MSKFVKSFFQKFFMFTQNVIKNQRISFFRDYCGLIYHIPKKIIHYKNELIIFQLTTFVGLKPIIPEDSRPPCTDNKKNIEAIITMAEKALSEGQIQEAETILLVGLKIAENNDMEEEICQIYDCLINISYSIGDFGNAQDLIHQIVSRLIRTGMKTDDDVIITFKLKLARLYSHTANNEVAESTFKECISLQKNKLDSGPLSDKTGILYIDLLFWYGIFLFQNEKFEEALKNVELAYNYSNKIQGINSSQELVILSILAEILCALAQYDQAIVYLTNAIVIGKSINHPELALSYVLLGNIYLKKELIQEAKRWCEEGAKLSLQQRNIRGQQASRVCLDKIKQAFDTKYELNQESA